MNTEETAVSDPGIYGDYCCKDGDCCGPGSWCCARAGQHEHPELDGPEGTGTQEHGP